MEIKKDKAILVALDLITNKYDAKDSLEELEELADTLDIVTVEKVIQKANRVSPRYFIGSGKVLEIKHFIDIHEATIVIFDDPLSPSQILNLEKALDVQIIDRSFLILSIFSERASSKQSILEVSLAQKEYMLPRLVGLGITLSRQGGGTYNAKGPGETKLELDRRKLSREIVEIKRELKKISKELDIERKKRVDNKIPIVSLVGYTNVGKSSLMNTLSKKIGKNDDEVFEKDMLFATLDTKTKYMQQTNKQPFLLTDTVGFIRKLPHELVRSFETTLRDVIDADLLLIVVDGTKEIDNQLNETFNTLKQIGMKDYRYLVVVTKKDLTDNYPITDEDYIFVSNKSLENIDDLISAIYGNIYLDNKIVELLIPFEKSFILNEIKDNNTILKNEATEEGFIIRAILSDVQINRYKKYLK